MWTLLDSYPFSSRFGEAGMTVLLSFDLGLFWLGKGTYIPYSFSKSAHFLSLDFVFNLLSYFDSVWTLMIRSITFCDLNLWTFVKTLDTLWDIITGGETLVRLWMFFWDNITGGEISFLNYDMVTFKGETIL